MNSIGRSSACEASSAWNAGGAVRARWAGIGVERVQPILRHVEVERAEIDGREFVDRVKDRLEIVVRVCVDDLSRDTRIPREREPVDSGEALGGNGVTFGIEIVQIRNQVP